MEFMDFRYMTMDSDCFFLGFHGSGIDFRWNSWISTGFPWIRTGFSTNFFDLGWIFYETLGFEMDFHDRRLDFSMEFIIDFLWISMNPDWIFSDFFDLGWIFHGILDPDWILYGFHHLHLPYPPLSSLSPLSLLITLITPYHPYPLIPYPPWEHFSPHFLFSYGALPPSNFHGS